MTNQRPPPAAPRAVRGGGIFGENDGGDRLQISECSEICDVRIPSGASRQLPLCPRGAFCGSEDAQTRVPGLPVRAFFETGMA